MEILHRKESVLRIVDKKEGAWRNLVINLEAPQPIYLGSRSPRWRQSDIEEYLADPEKYKRKLQVDFQANPEKYCKTGRKVS